MGRLSHDLHSDTNSFTHPNTQLIPPAQAHTCTSTHSYSHKHILNFTLTHKLAHLLICSLVQPQTHLHSLSHTHLHSHTLISTLPSSPWLSHTLAISRQQTHFLIHSLIHSHIVALSHTFTKSLSYNPWSHKLPNISPTHSRFTHVHTHTHTCWWCQRVTYRHVDLSAFPSVIGHSAGKKKKEKKRGKSEMCKALLRKNIDLHFGGWTPLENKQKKKLSSVSLSLSLV